MKSIIQAVQLALALIPQIIELIKSIELPGNGAAKAKVIIELVKAALELVPDDLVKLLGAEKVVAFVQRVIDIIIAFLNSVGLFRKSASSAG